MSCFPHTLLRTNVTLHVIRRKETTPVSYQTNEPLCTLTLTHYATASKKQLRSLSRREIVYLSKEIAEDVLGQVLGCDVREHLLGRRVVKGDLVLLDKLPVVDPSLLYVALNDESGFEPSVYLLLENEA